MDTPRDTEIAIIGLAGRFPGAADLEHYWHNLRDGVESIRRLSDEALIAAGVSPAEFNAADYVKACPVLDDADQFDAAFFGLSPRDAAVMDPAHRFFLEVCWEAVEQAGYTARPEEGVVGVFAGSGAPLYLIENLKRRPELMHSMGEFLVRHTGNDMNFLATRASYQMDLRGPSINVQTACSSALVAVHLACQSLLRGECAMALAGGSTILVPRGHGYVYKEGEILSPDGHCRPFDADSAGTVFGSGTGVVLLKRLQEALDDGDTIHAVIKGSAVNNDGASKVGYLAPGVDGQAAVIAAALDAAGVDADSIGYIETHGTGTYVGDPIEVEALNQAYRARTGRRRYCAIGSVKSNIGHLGEAAAAASLIKAVLALKHRTLPPSLGYRRPNPQIDFDDSPFFVNDRLRPWVADGPRRCGVTALGAGGTNCHLILEEAPPALPGEGERALQLLLLSAKSRDALDRATDRLAQALDASAELDLADAAYTLAVGRRPMLHRRVVVARDRADAAAALRQRDPARVFGQPCSDTRPTVVFMFGGGGTQYAGMGAVLYAQEPVYRDAIDACLAIAEPELGRDLRALIYCEPADAERAMRELERPSLTLPALFATEYALAQLFQSWGVRPTACIGHSMGEYVAACLAGVFTLDTGLRLVMLRGRLFERVASGGMLSVPLPEAELRRLLPPELSLAAVNAPELCVASGPVAAIEAFAAELALRDIEATRVRIDIAAHSAMLDPILEQFRAFCRGIDFQPPGLPFVSNLSGDFITTAEATDPEYWVRHLRSTVRFADGLQTLLAGGERVLLEVGPGRTLSMLARAQPRPVRQVLNSMRPPQESADDLAYALTTLGRLWAAGAEVDWSAFYDGQLRNRIALPTYPFERQSHWIEPGAPEPRDEPAALGKRTDPGRWFDQPCWIAQPLLRTLGASPGSHRWLVFGGIDAAFDRALLERLGGEAVLVSQGPHLVELAERRWQLDPAVPEQAADLIVALESRGWLPGHAVYLWPAFGPASATSAEPLSSLRPQIDVNFLGLTGLARALGALGAPVQLSVLTQGLVQIADEPVQPLQALVLGPVLVAPREFSTLTTRCIDAHVDPACLGPLVDELRAEDGERLVTLRHRRRWVQRLEPLTLPATGEPRSPGFVGATVLITGGLGGIGLELARHLARRGPVRLALLSRRGLPPEAEWGVPPTTPPTTREAAQIAHVRELRALGAEVLVVAGDVADAASLQSALDRIRQACGPLTAVVHAAGTMDDGLMATRSTAAMQAVLAPKLHGTLLLDRLVREPLDLFLVFSSVASVLGLPGQVDYTAANAFLDAFAIERAQRAPGRTTVVNWNAWREVGMAETLHRQQTGLLPPEKRSDHPALDGYTDRDTGVRVFITDFDAATHWLLAEHRVRGAQALLPGTAFVELARAAFAQGREAQAIEIVDLAFLGAFQVPDGQRRRLEIQLTETAAGHELTMRSGGDPKAAPQVTGLIRADTGEPPPALDLAAIAARCSLREERPSDRYWPQRFVDFGPRWANVLRLRFGAQEALLELALDPRFADDLRHYRLHPALLDMATGAAQALVPGIDLQRDFYVPLGYGRVRVFDAMPAIIFSHVRCLPDSPQGVACFDVTLATPDGRPIAEITRFTMKRLDAGSAMTSAAATASHAPRHDSMAELLREAIAPAEGLEALDRILAQPALVQVIASSVDVRHWRRRLDEPPASATVPLATGVDPAGASTAPHQRPTLSSEYVAPATDLERTLVTLWQEGLGMAGIGVRDDFFELGGHSLLLIQLVARAKKRAGVHLPLALLYANPTIAAWVALVAQAAPAPADAPTKPVLKRVVREAYRQPVRPG